MKNPSLSTLKKKTWILFSIRIRKKYANEDGMVQCISCPSIKHWKEMDAGHYLPKSLGLSIYFEEKNVHPQCTACNRFRHGNLTAYAIALRKRYGEGILEELETLKNTPRKISRGEYLELIEHYKGKLNA